MDKHDRKQSWGTHLGNHVTIEGMDDEHVANTIQFLTHYAHHNQDMLMDLKKEAELRGLSEEFLSKAQYPYKDGRGNYLVWDFSSNRPKIIGSYLRGMK